MSNERSETLSVWQEASRLERDALQGARQAITDLTTECEVDEYPRMAALDAVLREIDQTITQREIRIDRALKSEASLGNEPTRLQVLLSWQDDAHRQRAELSDARDAVADEEDPAFSLLTREIAGIDDEIIARAEEIETLAALAAVRA